ncbi:von Willebrand factor A [Sorangium cellulosum]|uniref:von Willebrand factor A n=1 Tax=Sorangium cellulosum TaxID=56 RepID=A0A2L0EPB9_SORCE|nr:VIT domain-containing protein [Sorangium cellulosum]AUX41144.1 von Willebrand factor A [Sorangium cellulosum]
MNPTTAALKLPSCLRSSEGHPVPLLGVSLSGEVLGGAARLVVRQRYRNEERKPIEAIYTFPLPSDATIAGFAMECAGRRLEGEVKEREEAFLAYDEAVATGHGAALLDEERPNVFTASVGNLLPGEETVVEVAFVQALRVDDGALRLMIPTLVAPRYIPGAPRGDRTAHGAAAPTDLVPDADRISPEIARVDYGISLDVVFDLGRDVAIESPSHALAVRREAGYRQRVSFRSDEAALDRDIVLLAAGAPGVQAGVVCDRRPGQEGTFAITVVPDLFDGRRAPARRDVVFVVDVSGSMQGESIEQAKRALRLCLRHLAEGDRFGVIAFSSDFQALSPALVPFTQGTLERADGFVAGLEADGGTEMMQPLVAAVEMLDDAGRDRVIVLLTDGQVGNEAAIVDRVVGLGEGVRVYTFGIGTNVSDLLVYELARRTEGAAEFIHPGERIDEKVTAQFARSTAARVAGIEARFEGVDAGELAPTEPPALVDGEPWVLYGRYGAPGMGRLHLRGKLRGEAFHCEVPVELAAEASRPALPALWAGARVRELEASERALSGKRAEAMRKRIVNLAVRHGVASRHASFVVIERRTGDRRVHGQPEARPVPVSAPAGWGMSGQRRAGRGVTTMGVVSRAGSIGAAPMSIGAAPRALRAAMAPGGGSKGASPVAFSPPQPAGVVGRIVARLRGADAEPATGAAPMAPASPAPQAWSTGAAASSADTLATGGPAASQRWPEAGPASAPAPGGAPGGPMSPAGGVGRMFEEQRASGLWERGEATDRGRLTSTALCLSACHEQGVDSAHPVYGAQVAKAIEALCALATSLLQGGGADDEVAAALAAAYLVASGRRLRARIQEAAASATSEAVRALAGELGDAGALKRRVEALRGA